MRVRNKILPKSYYVFFDFPLKYEFAIKFSIILIGRQIPGRVQLANPNGTAPPTRQTPRNSQRHRATSRVQRHIFVANPNAQRH